MTRIIKALDISQWTLIGLSLADIGNILNIIMLTVSIILGVVSIALKLKTYLSDGKLTDEEIKDVMKDANELKEKIEEEIKK